MYVSCVCFAMFAELDEIARGLDVTEAMHEEHVVWSFALAPPLLLVDAAAAKSSSKHGT